MSTIASSPAEHAATDSNEAAGSVEIERKYVLDELPAQIEGIVPTSIEQGYLAITDTGVEVRLRRTGDRRLITTKTGSGISRTEHEVDIPHAAFDALWPLTEGRQITKRRYVVGHGTLEIEVDQYVEELRGLIVAEVEFGSAEASAAFEPPDWLGREVTGDARYSNQRLAVDGAPPAPMKRSYKLRSDHPIPDELQRVAQGRVDKALGRLRNPHGDKVEAIHDTRTDLKKLRSLMRLVRKDLGRKRYERGQETFRAAGRLLSGRRDADVALETLDELLARDDAGQVHATTLRAMLTARRDRDHGSGSADGGEEKLAQAIEVLEGGRDEIDAWKVDGASFDALLVGLGRSYRRGRRFAAQLHHDLSDDDVHEWRKRVKDLWYQLRLVRDGWPAAVAALSDDAHELSSLLGDHHDISVLLAEAPNLAPDEPNLETIAVLGRQRQRELLDDAGSIAQRLYAEKPSHLLARLEAYWLLDGR